MAGDLNREASELWNSLKPIIDKEIDARTQGMVQRRKAKVTTAPSLNTNKIGVTEPFGSEMFIPFNTNIMSASVGDYVWVEYMYGMTNAFASMFASADEKDWDVAGDLSVGRNAGISGNLDVFGSTSLQNTTVNGVLDVTPRRCYSALSSDGWYRVCAISFNSLGEAIGSSGGIFRFAITDSYASYPNDAHTIDLLLAHNKVTFVNEASAANGYLEIDKIRYTYTGTSPYNGYVDIHFLGRGGTTYVGISFDYTGIGLDRQAKVVAQNLQSVAASPSGETVVKEYSFAANTNGNVTSSFSTSKGSVYAYRSGDMVTVTFIGDSTTWTEDEVFMTIADGIRPAMSIDVVSYIGRQACVVRINQNGNIVLWIGSTLTGNQRLYFSATYPIQH